MEEVSRIAFFAVVREKTFAIQTISYIKIPAKIKSARKHLRIDPDSLNSQNFSSTDNSRYTVAIYVVIQSTVWRETLEGADFGKLARKP